MNRLVVQGIPMRWSMHCWVTWCWPLQPLKSNSTFKVSLFILRIYFLPGEEIQEQNRREISELKRSINEEIREKETVSKTAEELRVNVKKIEGEKTEVSRNVQDSKQKIAGKSNSCMNTPFDCHKFADSQMGFHYFDPFSQCCHVDRQFILCHKCTLPHCLRKVMLNSLIASCYPFHTSSLSYII